jgi:amino acid adenylation domain-containing protein
MTAVLPPVPVAQTDVPAFPDAFARQVLRRPNAPALVWHGQVTTYRQLSDLADRAATRLNSLLLGRDEPLGILSRKTPDTVGLVLACLLLGRRFLLPSPALPEQALTTLFAQAGCRHVLSPAGGAPRLSPPAAPVRPTTPADAADVSFMLTTSGSTGLPKVVPLGRRAVDRFMAWAGSTFDLGPGRRVLNYAPLNFDLCLLDIWATLAHGGEVILVDPDQAANGRHLFDLLLRHEPHVVQAVPMFYRLLLDAPQRPGRWFESVSHAMFTGDAIGERTLAELPALFPAARLFNIYGSTETNDSFMYELDPAATAGPVPIGTPLPGVEALVVDPSGEVVDGPGTGELYVHTPFQTTGYLDRSRHADKFVTDPRLRDEHDPRRGDRRFFRTGDLVRRDPDGRVFLVGRGDFQVKVRGVAINTAEVESVLLEHPEVVEAAVVARADPLTGRELISAVRRTPGSSLNSLALRKHCARRLPRAAIPSAMRILDEPLPRTATGKVDRTAIVRLHELSSAKGRKP